MGVSLAASQGGATSQTQQNSSASSTPTFTGDQTSLQGMLNQVLQSFLPATASGGISQNVQNMQTAGADQINKTAAASGSKMDRFFASRGMGSSGASGQSALQTELARQSSLGANASAASGLQLAQNNTALSDALNFAFNTPGTQNAGQANASGSSTNWGMAEGASAKIPGFG